MVIKKFLKPAATFLLLSLSMIGYAVFPTEHSITIANEAGAILNVECFAGKTKFIDAKRVGSYVMSVKGETPPFVPHNIHCRAIGNTIEGQSNTVKTGLSGNIIPLHLLIERDPKNPKHLNLKLTSF